MRLWASPQVLSSKTKEKGTAPLAPSLSRLDFSMSLVLSLLLCAQVLSADAPSTAATFHWKHTQSKPLQRRGKRFAASRSEATHLSWVAARAFPCVRGKSLRGAHQALCCGVPPLSTRVIDGWVSAWPRLVHFALHRVPPSQSQTTMRTNNIGQRNLVIVREYNLYAFWLWLFFS